MVLNINCECTCQFDSNWSGEKQQVDYLGGRGAMGRGNQNKNTAA